MTQTPAKNQQEKLSDYTVPDYPCDPETAALELIVRLPIDLLGDHGLNRETLQEFTTLLSAEDTFAGMSWHDAKHAAVAIIFDATNRDDAAEFLRQRADRARAGTDGITWDDCAATVRALTTAAAVLAL
jgi:hypothetical protein